MPTVPVINTSGAGIGATGAGGVVGTALGVALRAGSMHGSSGNAKGSDYPPEADAAMATMLGLPGAPPARLESPDTESPRIQAHRDLVTATQHLPAAQRAQIQMQVLADPAAWGAKAPGEK